MFINIHNNFTLEKCVLRHKPKDTVKLNYRNVFYLPKYHDLKLSNSFQFVLFKNQRCKKLIMTRNTKGAKRRPKDVKECQEGLARQPVELSDFTAN